MPRKRIRIGHAYRELRKRVFAEESHCYRCGGPVDQRLRYPHPASRSLDHVHLVTDGGTNTRSNAHLSHLRCNTTHGARVQASRRHRTPPAPRHSRAW